MPHPIYQIQLSNMPSHAIPIKRLGFTLVELLVVIAIIGILMAMTLPAIQSARESSRRTQCKNNLRNLAHAASSHLTANGFFPSGGWEYIWASDPDRGFGMGQPRGWLYSILPYIEESNLHQRGQGLPNAQKRAIGARRVATPIPAFNCPTRRRPEQNSG
jgi:prepilin-type N-terminal cleavage/methylation domain-containing protein